MMRKLFEIDDRLARENGGPRISDHPGPRQLHTDVCTRLGEGAFRRKAKDKIREGEGEDEDGNGRPENPGHLDLSG